MAVVLSWRSRRSVLALAFLLTGCSGEDRPPAKRTASTTAPRGPDALMLRIPRTGGVARATAYPIDTNVWTGSEEVPALNRVLAFDAEAGLIAAEDADGGPLWIDLRVGAVTSPTQRSVRGLASADGGTIYGVADGAIARFTPAGNTSFETPLPTRIVFPQRSGTLIALGGRASTAHIWRMHPPEPLILDTLALPDATGGTTAPLGDRVYIVAGRHRLVGVNPRTLELVESITFDQPIVDVETTPSGDRLYVITDSAKSVQTVQRYQDRVSGRIELPGRARALRVDPFGRYVLARAAAGDSVWVIGVGSDRVLGTVQTPWRGDVPFVAPDGLVAVETGEDIAFIDPVSMREIRRTIFGASEFWYPFLWNGFRPRAAVLDQPASFAKDSDSVAVVAAPPARETIVATPVPRVDSARLGFTVSFSALLDEPKARALAAKITVNGRNARVVINVTDGTTVYRVVLGPYPTRDEADRVGRASGQPYYVYAGSP